MKDYEPPYVICKNSDPTPLCQSCTHLEKATKAAPCNDCKAIVSTRPKNFYSRRGPQ